MRVNIQELLSSAGLNEPVYPGKKLVKAYAQPGAYKSHCVVVDWRDSSKLHVEVKAGLTGRTLDAYELHNYPVSFQAPTFVDIAIGNDDEKEDDEDTETGKGKSGSGGKKPARKLEDSALSLREFGRATEGALPELGQITKFVVMGKELAKEAYAQAYANLTAQLGQAKIMVMDLMKDVGNIIKKATPGGGLEARGDETVKYKYDAERTAPMFGGMAPS